MSKESVAKTLYQWERLIAASEANPGDLDYLAQERAELKELAQKVKSLTDQQDTLAAMRQQVTRDLDAAKERGREVAVRMRYGIRSTYGAKSEKLIEFGLKPRRKRRRSSESEPPPEEG